MVAPLLNWYPYPLFVIIWLRGFRPMLICRECILCGFANCLWYFEIPSPVFKIMPKELSSSIKIQTVLCLLVTTMRRQLKNKIIHRERSMSLAFMYGQYATCRFASLLSAVHPPWCSVSYSCNTGEKPGISEGRLCSGEHVIS